VTDGARRATEEADASAAPRKAVTERRDGVQVLERAAQMLRALSAEPNGLTPIELADRVGLPRSTAYRIVGTLASEGFMRASPGGKLFIGAGLISIATAGRRDLRHEAAPYLEQLSHELHETVELVVLDGGEALFTNQFVSSRSLRVVAQVGDRFPLHCTACGKALLAELPEEDALALIPARLERFTPHTDVDRRRLLKSLETVRADGVAYDHQEHTIGVSAVGAAIRDASGALAALTVVMPAARLEGHEEHIAAAVLRVRDEIQRVVNGEAPVRGRTP
jgi:DNA-binding IclR family transcriptional regulator